VTVLHYEETATCDAPVEEVWALLYDPARLPEWWEATARSEAIVGGANRYTRDAPDVAVPTRIHRAPERSRVVISCQVADVVWEWTLKPAEAGCRVRLNMQLADGEAHLFDSARADMRASIRRLVAAAERGSARSGG
jgi:uncharacterized protein YndB with AHSA1/START domain